LSEAEALFAGKDAAALETYRALIAAIRPFGPFAEEAKKTSIHLAASRPSAGCIRASPACCW
jgi:hypothetical protein